MRTLAALLLCIVAHAAAALDVGTLAPDFHLSGRSDQPVSLSALRGQVVYVDFWASWCGPCRRSLPWLDAMLTRYGAQGFTVVAVNVDRRRSDAERFLAQVPLKLPLAFDAAGDTAKSFTVTVMPSSYVIGRDGRVRAMHTGYRDDEEAVRETELKQLLAEQ